MKLRRAVATTGLVGAVIAIAVVVGGLSYYVGQSGSSPPVTLTSTMATTVTGAGTTSLTTVIVTSSGVATTITSTLTATSTLASTTTTVVTSPSVVLNCKGIQGNCVSDDDGDGI